MIKDNVHIGGTIEDCCGAFGGVLKEGVPALYMPFRDCLWRGTCHIHWTSGVLTWLTWWSLRSTSQKNLQSLVSPRLLGYWSVTKKTICTTMNRWVSATKYGTIFPHSHLPCTFRWSLSRTGILVLHLHIRPQTMKYDTSSNIWVTSGFTYETMFHTCETVARLSNFDIEICNGYNLQSLSLLNPVPLELRIKLCCPVDHSHDASEWCIMGVSIEWCIKHNEQHSCTSSIVREKSGFVLAHTPVYLLRVQQPQSSNNQMHPEWLSNIKDPVIFTVDVAMLHEILRGRDARAMHITKQHFTAAP